MWWVSREMSSDERMIDAYSCLVKYVIKCVCWSDRWIWEHHLTNQVKWLWNLSDRCGEDELNTHSYLICQQVMMKCACIHQSYVIRWGHEWGESNLGTYIVSEMDDVFMKFSDAWVESETWPITLTSYDELLQTMFTMLVDEMSACVHQLSHQYHLNIAERWGMRTSWWWGEVNRQHLINYSTHIVA